MKFLIPILCSIFMRCGGWGINDYFYPFIKIKQPKNAILRLIIGKLREWGISGLMWAYTGNWTAFIAYFLALNIPYGDNENNWLRKLVGRDINWLIYGFLGGLASFPILKWWAILQGIISGLAFYILMRWSNNGFFVRYRHKLSPLYNFLDHSYVEILYGGLNCLLYLFV